MEDFGYMSPKLERWREGTDIPLLVLAIGSLPFLLLELVAGRLPNSDNVFLIIVNLVVFVAFLVDYIAELCVSSNKASYVRHEWTSLLIVLAQALALLPALTAFGALRLLRVVRTLSVLARLGAIGGATRKTLRHLLKRRAVTFAFGTAVLTCLSSAVGFTLVEDVGEGRRIHSFFDALWWSASTISTVGYGDIFPITAAGRVIAIFTMLIGVTSFAVVTAKVAQFLIHNDTDS
jgi:voltage-gated potassium channel